MIKAVKAVGRRRLGRSISIPITRKNTILAFNEGMKNLKEALANRNFESQSLTVAKAKRNIRNDVFEEPECRFNGVFEPGCQSRAVPGYQFKVLSLDAFKNECHQRLSKIGNGQTKPSLILCVSVTTILIDTVALPYSDVTNALVTLVIERP